MELKTAEDRLKETTKQLEDLQHLLDSKNDEICKLKKLVCKQADQLAEKSVRLELNQKKIFFCANFLL